MIIVVQTWERLGKRFNPGWIPSWAFHRRRNFFQNLGYAWGEAKIGVADTVNNLSRLRPLRNKFYPHFLKIEPWVKEVQPASEESLLIDKEYPLTSIAGNHMEGW
jgi:hypothetical protein